MDLMPHHHHPHAIGPETMVMVQQVQQVQQMAMQPLMATALMPNCTVSGVSHSKGVRYQLDPTSFARLLPPFWFRYNVMWVKMHSSHPN